MFLLIVMRPEGDLGLTGKGCLIEPRTNSMKGSDVNDGALGGEEMCWTVIFVYALKMAREFHEVQCFSASVCWIYGAVYFP